MIHRIILYLWAVMILTILAVQGIGRIQHGHLFMYSTLDTDQLIILDTQTMIDVFYPSRLAYQNVQWSTVGSRFYFSRNVEYSDDAVRFALNLFGTDVINADVQELLETHTITVPNSAGTGRWIASPDGSQIAYITTVEDRTYFAVVGSQGEAIVPLHQIQTARPNKLIWSSDSQSVYLLNLSNNKIRAYEYDVTSEILSNEQIWLESDERLLAMYPSPAGERLLLYENNSDTLFAYTISTGTIEAIVHYDGDSTLETFHSSLTWSRDGTAFALGYRITDSDIGVDVFLADGTILYQETVHLPYSSVAPPDISVSGVPYVASIASLSYPLCLYYFASSQLHCLSTGDYTYPIGFSL